MLIIMLAGVLSNAVNAAQENSDEEDISETNLMERAQDFFK